MTDPHAEATISTKPFAYDDIQWRGEPALRDHELWERNLGVVRLLIEHTTPTEIIDNDSAERIPSAYELDGVAIEFLPHWGGYEVGELFLKPPADTEETLLADVAAAKALKDAKAAAAEYVESRGQGQSDA